MRTISTIVLGPRERFVVNKYVQKSHYKKGFCLIYKFTFYYLIQEYTPNTQV